MSDNRTDFVAWFRAASPYLHAHRDRTFVVCLGGEALAAPGFPHLIHDLALLDALGVRLVLVHGARPQIEARLKARGAAMRYEDGVRVTDAIALECVREAVGSVRVEIEALLSQGVTNSPMEGARIRVASGNFVTARPYGIRNGVDFGHTGEVRRVDIDAIRRRLGDGDLVLVPALGYSPTGEVFNLNADEVATAVAIALGADKLIFLHEGAPLTDEDGQVIGELTPEGAERLATRLGRLPDDLVCALEATAAGVPRAHLVPRAVDGGLLIELFTRDGIGTLVAARPFDDLRQATIDDIPGILQIIAPLEDDGTLVRRSREKLELEIDHFHVLVRDRAIIGCVALYPWPEAGLAEIACLAVHPDYRRRGKATLMFEHLLAHARSMHLSAVFILTTRTSHWFRERGFREVALERLPLERQSLYNFCRNARVLLLELSPRDNPAT
ncbi:MAG TPA: amino-acid N-acetyltransferase [Gammaproteobacteria bacterium]|nr:amino-acid N-acetyltransferase [Gammaproteobacteria bacterium]